MHARDWLVSVGFQECDAIYKLKCGSHFFDWQKSKIKRNRDGDGLNRKYIRDRLKRKPSEMPFNL